MFKKCVLNWRAGGWGGGALSTQKKAASKTPLFVLVLQQEILFCMPTLTYVYIGHGFV